MDILNVGYTLRTYRKAEHLAQKEIAFKLGISRVHYSRLENGERYPSFGLLCRIVKLIQSSGGVSDKELRSHENITGL